MDNTQQIDVRIQIANKPLKEINKGINVKTISTKDLISEIRTVQQSTNVHLTELIGNEKGRKKKG